MTNDEFDQAIEAIRQGQITERERRVVAAAGQELVEPLEIFLHHNMIGDNPRCVDPLRFQL
jgi:hypothetical protein